MIDLHCHILPGIDDGSLDLDDSLEMAHEADRDGIEAVCATPHIRHDHDVVIAEIAARVAQLNDALAHQALAVRVLTGGEVAETIVRTLDDEELRRVSLGGAGSWILLEPAPGPLGPPLRGAVEHLAARGYRALIAHPERHLTADLLDALRGVVAAGALVQATAAMFLHPRAAPWMLELAAHGLVHTLASDSHSSRSGRPLRLREALERLRGVEHVAAHLDWIFHAAPAAIVRGDPLEAPFPVR